MQSPARPVKKLAKLLRLLARPPYRRGLRHGVGAAIEHRGALGGLALTTAVDIGANKGQFSLFLVETFPGAQVYAFEPLAKAAARFRAVFRGDARVTLHQTAIGPEQGPRTIYVSGREDSSSLLPITPLQDAVFPGTALKETATVPVAPLDEFLTRDQIQPPALLKLDVQGYELEALRGCQALLPRFAYIYAECSYAEFYAGQALADEIIDHLRHHGFHLAGIFNTAYDRKGRAVQADFLFRADGQ